MRLPINEHLVEAFIDFFDARRDSLYAFRKPDDLSAVTLKREMGTEEMKARIWRHLMGERPSDRVGLKLKRDSDGRGRIDKANGFTKSFCIDLDAHRPEDNDRWVDALRLRSAFHHNGFEVYLERSKNGRGVHVWGFFDGRVHIKPLWERVRLILREAKLEKAEILPSGNTYGTAPNSPYFGFIEAESSGLCAFLDAYTMRPYPLEWLLLGAERNPVTLIPEPQQPKVDKRFTGPERLWRRGIMAKEENGRALPRCVEHGDAEAKIPARNTPEGACRAAGIILATGGGWERFTAWNAMNCTPPLEGGELLKIWQSIERRHQIQSGADAGLRLIPDSAK